MRKAGAFATLFFVLHMGLPVLAEDNLDGNALLLKCAAGARIIDQKNGSWGDMVQGNYCMGLVRGVHGTASDLAEPDAVTLGQEIRIALHYLQNHPEELHKSDAFLVHEALRKAFPAK